VTAATASSRPLYHPGRRIPELDGVRGIAILLVLLFHFAGGTLPDGVVRNVTLIGWSGVDLFFVLSGFLLTGILLDTRESPRYFRSFYARRGLRTLPIYFIFLFVTLRIALPLAHTKGYFLQSVDSGSEIWYWTLLSNWHSPFEPAAGGPLSHLWSLAIEEQFYLVWPLAVFLARGVRLAWISLGLVVLSLTLRLFWPFDPAFPEVMYRWTPFRMEPLVLGALVAWVARQPALEKKVARAIPALFAVAAAGLCAVLAIAKDPTNLNPEMIRFGFTPIAVLYAIFVFQAGVAPAKNGWFSKALRAGWLRSFGKYSYAIYIVHLPLALAAVEGKEIASAQWGWPHALGSLVGGVSLSFALALLSWELIEKRFLALKSRFSA
jgi:peptidoglycan/LPS O-acetylase OafA/YrhL